MTTATKTTSINIRSDEETKNSFSELCSELGLSVSSALNLVMKSAVRNKEIPVKLTAYQKPAALDDFTDEELSEMLAKQEEDFKNGNYFSVEDVNKRLDQLEAKYGI